MHCAPCYKPAMGKKKKNQAPPVAPESFNLPCNGADSHAHLDDKRFSDDLDAVLERARAAGVASIGQVFTSLEEWNEAHTRLAAYPELFFILGIHPIDADLWSVEAGQRIRDIFAQETRLKAVGEIGLDYYWDNQPRDLQAAVFRAQLSLGKELGVPVVIHCRDAVDDTLAILLEAGFSGRPLLWHCFGHGAALAETILEHGWHISIPGPVTFSANRDLQDAVKIIPDNRLLLETDCPYLTPNPYRGQRNEPAYMVFTGLAVAELRGQDPAELWTRCGDNARRFFGV